MTKEQLIADIGGRLAELSEDDMHIFIRLEKQYELIELQSKLISILQAGGEVSYNNLADPTQILGDNGSK